MVNPPWFGRLGHSGRHRARVCHDTDLGFGVKNRDKRSSPSLLSWSAQGRFVALARTAGPVLGMEQRRLEADVLLPARTEREAAEQKAKGAAAPIAEDGRARLMVLDQMIKLYQGAGTEAERIFILNMLPDIVREIAHSAEGMEIGKVTVIDSGDRGTGVGSAASQLPAAIIKITEQIETATGVNILSRLGGRTPEPHPRKGAGKD